MTDENSTDDKSSKDEKTVQDKPKVVKPTNRGRTFSGGGTEKRG